MPTTTTLTVVAAEVPPGQREAIAVAGFLAGYCGSTRRSYDTDLRLFARWCQEGRLTLFNVRRAHLELYGRWMEETGRMRSTVARRLSTLASFYRYLAQEEFIDRNPAGQRPPAKGRLRVPYARLGPQRGSARSWSKPGSARPAIMPWRRCWR